MTDEQMASTARAADLVTIPHVSRYHRERCHEDMPTKVLAETIQHFEAVVSASQMANHGGEKDEPQRYSVFVELHHGLGDGLNSLVANGHVDILGINVVAPTDGGSQVIEVVPVLHEFADVEMKRTTLEGLLDGD